MAQEDPEVVAVRLYESSLPLPSRAGATADKLISNRDATGLCFLFLPAVVSIFQGLLVVLVPV